MGLANCSSVKINLCLSRPWCRRWRCCFTTKPTALHATTREIPPFTGSVCLHLNLQPLSYSHHVLSGVSATTRGRHPCALSHAKGAVALRLDMASRGGEGWRIFVRVGSAGVGKNKETSTLNSRDTRTQTHPPTTHTVGSAAASQQVCVRKNQTDDASARQIRVLSFSSPHFETSPDKCLSH